MARNKNVYVDFTQEEALALYNTATGITALAADTTANAFRTSSGQYFEQWADGQNDQLVLTGGANDGTGWVMAHDNAADALEITPGITSGRAVSFTTGTDAAFFLQCVFMVGTVARNTMLTCGFRKLGAYVTIKAANAATALAAHTDKAGIGVVAVAGTLATQTSLNNTDAQTTLAKAAVTDNQYLALKVLVSSAGVVTYQVGVSSTAALAVADLAADANAVAFTFDTAEVLIPYIQKIGTALTGIGDSKLISFQCGYQDTN